MASGEDVVEEDADSEGADAADNRGDSNEVRAVANIVGDIAFDNTMIAGGASINDDGAWLNHRIRNQAGNAGCSDDYIILVKLCQVIATMKHVDREAEVFEHLVKWGADEFAASDDGDFLIGQFDVVASK